MPSTAKNSQRSVASLIQNFSSPNDLIPNECPLTGKQLELLRRIDQNVDADLRLQ
jgi:hypothetical protein